MTYDDDKITIGFCPLHGRQLTDEPACRQTIRLDGGGIDHCREALLDRCSYVPFVAVTDELSGLWERIREDYATIQRLDIEVTQWQNAAADNGAEADRLREQVEQLRQMVTEARSADCHVCGAHGERGTT